MTPSSNRDKDHEDSHRQPRSQQLEQPDPAHAVSAAQTVLRSGTQTQLDPQEPNRDPYGDQETGATSGEVGDGRSPRQVAHSGSQATQHSAGGSQQQDSARAARDSADKQR